MGRKSLGCALSIEKYGNMCLINEYLGDFGVHKHNECKSAKNVLVLCLLKWKSIVFSTLCVAVKYPRRLFALGSSCVVLRNMQTIVRPIPDRSGRVLSYHLYGI
jgi:hypothetical protein